MNLYERVFGSGPRGIAASVALLLAAAAVKPFLSAGDLCLPGTVRWAVLAGTAAAAAALGAWCVHVLPIRQRGRGLCQTGPYRFVRHPFYAAFLSIFDFGLALFLNHAVFLLWAVLLHPLWHWLIRYEERLMRREFGDAYRDYAARTGRFLPRLSAFRHPRS